MEQNSQKLYYILSVKWSKHNGAPTWWGTDCYGYTTMLKETGVYTGEQIFESPEYFNNKYSTVAIEKEVADRATEKELKRWVKRKIKEAQRCCN